MSLRQTSSKIIVLHAVEQVIIIQPNMLLRIAHDIDSVQQINVLLTMQNYKMRSLFLVHKPSFLLSYLLAALLHGK